VKNLEPQKEKNIFASKKNMPEVVSKEQSPFPSEAAKSILARAPESNQSLQR
jgi:hypothetical protein